MSMLTGLWYSCLCMYHPYVRNRVQHVCAWPLFVHATHHVMSCPVGPVLIAIPYDGTRASYSGWNMTRLARNPYFWGEYFTMKRDMFWLTVNRGSVLSTVIWKFYVLNFSPVLRLLTMIWKVSYCVLNFSPVLRPSLFAVFLLTVTACLSGHWVASRIPWTQNLTACHQRFSPGPEQEHSKKEAWPCILMF